MGNNVKNILKLMLFISLILLPMVSGFFILINPDWFNSLDVVIRYIIGIVIIIFPVAVLFFIPKTHLLDGVLKNSFKKTEDTFKRYDEKNKKEIELLSIDKEKYINTSKVYSQLNRIKGLSFILISIIMLIYVIILSKQFNLATMLFLIITFVLIYNYFGRIIKISPEGIRSASLLRNQFISWEKIKTIGISTSGGSGKNNLDWFIWVYVSKREIKSNRLMASGRESKGFIVFKFRVRIIHHILCYYRNEIINLHNVRRWRRYLKKNGQSSNKED